MSVLLDDTSKEIQDFEKDKNFFFQKFNLMNKIT